MSSNREIIPKYLEIFKESDDISINKILEKNSLTVSNPLVLTDNFTSRFLDKIKINQLKYFHEILKGNAIDFLDELIQSYHGKKIDLIISVGGGTISDAGKYIAKKMNIPMFSFPTAISNDGIASPISVLKGKNNEKLSIGTKLPSGIFLILDIIKNSPVELIRSGIGDLVSNISAVWDWQLSKRINDEPYNEYAASIALNSAFSVFYYVLKNFEDEDTIRNLDFINLLSRGLVVSGLAMSITGSSRPCSGSEHEISHSMDQYFGGISHHGIQVSLGTLFSTFLQDNLFSLVVKFNEKVNLPLSYRDLNLSENDFVKILIKAPKTRANRFTILEHLNLKEDEYINKIEQWIDEIEQYR